MPSEGFDEIRAARLAAEVGTIHKQATHAIALCYPSPYAVGMSSLGFQTVYRLLNELPGFCAERAFLPDDARRARDARDPLRTYESARPVGDFPIVAFSLAYELELAGLVDCLDLAGIPAFADDRAAAKGKVPLVVVGGPLTFSNPLPAAPYADVMLLGESEETLPELCAALRDEPDRRALLAGLAARPGFYVPAVHGPRLPGIAKAKDENLPAFSRIRTPNTELRDMFLIEPERGCHRGCTYCVMRR
ncbi:MAG TPA: radical SAM protein, partial [Polyangia bacterium]|nr:radical SAM protein [Polyangia bacterium]